MARLQTILAKGENPYALLGLIPPQSHGRDFDTASISSAMIRQAYFQRARECHPDRCPDRQDEFVKLQASYELLMDPNDRRSWDQQASRGLNPGDASSDVSLRELRQYHEQVQYIAECQRASMALNYHSNVDLETKRHGLIILRAIYGKLPPTGYDVNDDTSCIDVVQALQCQVHQSQLTIDRGEPKWHLEGFYIPRGALVNHCLLLRVCYYYQNQLHEVQVTDTEALRLPLLSHGLSTRPLPASSSSAKKKNDHHSPNYESMLKHQRRKQWLTWTSVVLAIGFMYTTSNTSSPFNFRK